MLEDLDKVTRLELIDHTKCESCYGTGRQRIEGQPGDFECPSCHGLGSNGRTVVFIDGRKQIETSLQDDGRTLKIFISKRTAIEASPANVDNMPVWYEQSKPE